MTQPKQKLELTWIGKEQRPRLEQRILIEDPYYLSVGTATVSIKKPRARRVAAGKDRFSLNMNDLRVYLCHRRHVMNNVAL